MATASNSAPTPSPVPPVFGNMQLVPEKHGGGLRLSAYFASSADVASTGTDMHGEMINGVLISAGSVWPYPPALTDEIKARLNAAWPLAQGAFIAINDHLKSIRAPHRLSWIIFQRHFLGIGKWRWQMDITFSPMPASGARGFSLSCECGSPLHLAGWGAYENIAASLSPDEFAAIFAGDTIRGLDRASFEAHYKYARPEGVQAAWQVAIAEMPAIAALLSILGLP